jgi:crossover junction endodeoxyribonuclease RuvC
LRRILGIDPGSRVTGYGVIESDGIRSRHIASGCIRAQGDDFPARLGVIFEGLSEVIALHRPVEIAVEEVFFARNAASALKLGQARGAAICAAVTRGLPVKEYAARAVKQAIVGTGGADKEQVQHMVKLMLNLGAEALASDQADALAVALSHAHTEATLEHLSRAGAGWRR